MMPLEVLLAGMLLVSLTFYVLMGGADYGAGVWNLLAWGPRAQAQRQAIAHAIGPIWEANHVWLILVVTILFTAFPRAYSIITTYLHIPLTLMLAGIVLRGSAFAFRSYSIRKDSRQKEWGLVFSFASLFTPIVLGMILGAIASGRLSVGPRDFLSTFVWPWLGIFPLAVGLLALALFAFLAAVYLAAETGDAELREDFRSAALISAVALDLQALLVYALARGYAPAIAHDLGGSVWGTALLGLTALVAVVTIAMLWWRRFRTARVCAVAQAILIVWGWALAQYPYIVEPDLTLFNAAAPRPTLSFLLMAITLGAFILFPSLYYLLHIFKGRLTFEDHPDDR